MDFKKIIQQLKNRIRGKPTSFEKIIQPKKTETSIKINIQTENRKIMTMFNYGVGGNEIKVDANESIQEIQENKTLLVSKLTTDDTISPEIVTDLKTVEDVFKHFKPSLSVDHETADGEVVSEEFSFKNIADFAPKSIIENSDFLKNQNLEQEQYNGIIRKLRNNKVLNNALNNSDAKAKFIERLREVASELEKNNQK